MIETLLQYMLRRLQDYRAMKVENELPLQHDFPNCGKNGCCSDHWNKSLENVNEDVKNYIKLQQDVVGVRRWDTEFLKHNKAPKDFENIRVEWNIPTKVNKK